MPTEDNGDVGEDRDFSSVLLLLLFRDKTLAFGLIAIKCRKLDNFSLLIKLSRR
ncbi:unnamed protein product [Schistosoma curassoni]|uniref:Uncharacterized protein n=1 Tax=Schistosoma curassoni TaxID=6186 RepID=A0A183K7I8_9TREM|nr:unnamed protein product [Schistosoma curassoni]